ncbi:hypothetical protein LSUE1_G006157 [Lachnellula suecica]|uniref:Uncharacterized protein n=1 Tax=Lachnellula suecica TaxID=602035 RepID=A0A8T9BUM1_9HELO|nr:hypothetical protein LSUE1_G006157 [Lachnellula suecica]
MPNWKTYESSVRLLSAIVAAHPGLKLNYDGKPKLSCLICLRFSLLRTLLFPVVPRPYIFILMITLQIEVARFLGGGAKYKTVWDRMNQINKHAKHITAAVNAGQDPSTVEVQDASKPKAQDIAARFGGDCTKSALENRFRRIKTDAKRMNDALSKGIDPGTLAVGDQGEVATRGGRGEAEIARCYGSQATKSSIMNVFTRNVNPNVKNIQNMHETGGDPQDVILKGLVGSGTEIVRWFGPDATPDAIRQVVNKMIGPYNKKIAAAVQAGGLPTDVSPSEFGWARKGTNDQMAYLFFVFGTSRSPSVSDSKIARFYGADANKKAIINAFHRYVKLDVKMLNETVDNGGNPKDLDFSRFSLSKIALCYGNQVTKTALTTHFARDINPNARTISDARKRGDDTSNIVMLVGVGNNGKPGKEIALCYGSHASKIGLQTHFQRDIAPNVKAISEARKRGDDAKNIVLVEGVRNGKPGKEIVHYFGSGTTKSGLTQYIARNINPNVKTLTETRQRGEDPKGAILVENVRDGKPGKEIAKHFGSHTTPRGVEAHFSRNIKPNAKPLAEALERGADPKNVIMVDGVRNGRPGKEIAKCYDSDLKPHTLYCHMKTHFMPMVELVKQARGNGDNPLGITIPGVKHIAKCYDTNLKTPALYQYMRQNVNPMIELVKQACERGDNPLDIAIPPQKRGSGQTSWLFSSMYSLFILVLLAASQYMDLLLIVSAAVDTHSSKIVKHFGDDTTPGGLSKHMQRHVTPGVKSLQACVKAGNDPRALNIGGDGVNEIQQCFGSDATVLGLRFQVSTVIKPTVALIQKARAAGQDCKDLGIGTGSVASSKGRRHLLSNFIFLPSVALRFILFLGYFINATTEVSRVFGSDSTPNGLRFQFTDRFRPVAQRQLDMLDAGQDPKDINLDDCKPTKGGKGGRGSKDLASLMGSDTTVSALKSEIVERVKSIGKHQIYMRAAGQDPAKIDISSFDKVSKYFGTDSTGGGIGFQFRTIKADAKRQRDCVAAGRDPKDLNIGLPGKEIARLLNDDTTAAALEHRFRPIKKAGAEMKAEISKYYPEASVFSLQHRFRPIIKEGKRLRDGGAIAREYGDGVTGKAVSTYFERARKEPSWNRGDTPVKTPGSGRKRGPKGSAKKAASSMEDTPDDDDEETYDTPSKKKGANNKTMGGRITKSSPRKVQRKNYQGMDDDEEEDHDNESEEPFVKNENHNDSFAVSNNGYHNGNDYGEEHEGHAETFYAAAEDYGDDV